MESTSEMTGSIRMTAMQPVVGVIYSVPEGFVVLKPHTATALLRTTWLLMRRCRVQRQDNVETVEWRLAEKSKFAVVIVLADFQVIQSGNSTLMFAHAPCNE